MLSYMAVPSPIINEARVRVVVVGYSGAGKTSLVHCLVHGTSPPPRPMATVGIDWKTKNYDANEDRVRVTAMFCDCGGQSRFGSLRHQSASTADVILLVMDLSNKEVCSYREEAYMFRKLAPTAPIILVGTHADRIPPEVDGRDEFVAGCMKRHDILEETQARMYANKIFVVSSVSQEGIPDLEEALEHVYTLQASYQDAFRESAARSGTLHVPGDGTAVDTEKPMRPTTQYLLGLRTDPSGGTPMTEARGALAAAQARAIAQAPMYASDDDDDDDGIDSSTG